MKKLYYTIGVICVIGLISVACQKVSLNEKETNASQGLVLGSSQIQKESESESQVVRPDFLKSEIEVEYGSTEILLEDIIEGYDSQPVTIVEQPTEDQFKLLGSSFDLKVLYEETSFVVSVKVIDTVAPTFKGLSEISIVEGESIYYKDGVKVSDNTGEKIEFEIDKSGVDRDTPGTYYAVYTATDASGNTCTEKRKVIVNKTPKINEALVTPMADKVIKEVITDDMSDWDKAYALWYWCLTHIGYSTSSGDRSSVWTGAYEGFHDNWGDCFTYYATYEVLLTRVGIPNMKVARINGNTNHWWNLVNVGDGWYHCDCSPRKTTIPYKCFMQTDAQIAAYTELYTKYVPDHPNYYTFDPDLYPERETKEVFDGKMHVIE